MRVALHGCEGNNDRRKLGRFRAWIGTRYMHIYGMVWLMQDLVASVDDIEFVPPTPPVKDIIGGAATYARPDVSD